MVGSIIWEQWETSPSKAIHEMIQVHPRDDIGEEDSGDDQSHCCAEPAKRSLTMNAGDSGDSNGPMHHTPY